MEKERERRMVKFMSFFDNKKRREGKRKGRKEEHQEIQTRNKPYLKCPKISAQSGGLSNLPKFGFSFPARILSAVLFPVPFCPTNPKICPGLGMGSR